MKLLVYFIITREPSKGLPRFYLFSLGGIGCDVVSNVLISYLVIDSSIVSLIIMNKVFSVVIDVIIVNSLSIIIYSFSTS